jgi:hypothetical protein
MGSTLMMYILTCPSTMQGNTTFFHAAECQMLTTEASAYLHKGRHVTMSKSFQHAHGKGARYTSPIKCRITVWQGALVPKGSTRVKVKMKRAPSVQGLCLARIFWRALRDHPVLILELSPRRVYRMLILPVPVSVPAGKTIRFARSAVAGMQNGSTLSTLEVNVCSLTRIAK